LSRDIDPIGVLGAGKDFAGEGVRADEFSFGDAVLLEGVGAEFVVLVVALAHGLLP
jgi:hypothetical protein